MNLEEFIQKPLVAKVNAVQEQGTFLVLRSYGAYYVGLYHMDSFFCEIWHDSVTDNVLFADSFEGIVRLDPYLQPIQLDVLY